MERNSLASFIACEAVDNASGQSIILSAPPLHHLKKSPAFCCRAYLDADLPSRLIGSRKTFRRVRQVHRFRPAHISVAPAPDREWYACHEHGAPCRRTRDRADSFSFHNQSFLMIEILRVAHYISIFVLAKLLVGSNPLKRR